MNRVRPMSLLYAVPLVALASSAFYFFRIDGRDSFMPHSHCYLFNEQLIALHGGSDLFIGLSYCAISATLTYLVFRSRRELPFHWMMLAFATFIVACGATHFMEVWTLEAQDPVYWFSGWVKLVTALASVTTAVLLPPLVPRIRAVLQAAQRSTAQAQELERANRELQALYAEVTDARDSLQAELDSQSRTLAQLAAEVSTRARELAKAKDEAEAANRAKDQFLAVLSHELRTPLTPALAATSSLLSDSETLPAGLKEPLSMVRRNIELEARLVDDLLDLTRISRGKLQIRTAVINLHLTIRHAVEMCQAEAAHKRIELVTDLSATDFYVSGDGARLAQVVWNLLLNAIKFTPAGGRVQVATSNPRPGFVEATVKDNGIGIDEEMLDQIFEPFQQGSGTRAGRNGGLGLGLTVARGLIVAHGGTISAASKGHDQGAVLTVTMPIVSPPPSVDATVQGSPVSSQQQLRILLVEDHEDTKDTLNRLLTRWGHEVTAVDNVASALTAVATACPDVLISDIGLPDGTGMDLLRRLRCEREIPAIAMSGYGMESDLTESKEAGFTHHLIKPVSAELLRDTLQQLMES